MSSSFDKTVQNWTKRRIYQRIPLDTTQKYIRLLELLPGMPGDKLTGRLFVASLDQAPNYNAVSYVWGDQSRAFSITLNGRMALRIGRNLHHALRDLRHIEHPIILWTDAICIQQGSDQEQNHQVQLMAQIYSRAKSVRAWIDHEMDTASEIFQRLPDVLNSKDLRADMEFWSPAMNLLQNPYWKRLWIQQELILSREIVINCRDTVLDPRSTDWLLNLPLNVSVRARNREDRRLYNVDMGINGDYTQPIFGGISFARSVNSRRSDIHRSLQLTSSDFFNDVSWASLLTLFLDTYRLETSEQKDRVYGMLGLAMDFEEGDIAVEYALPLASVYAKIPEMFLNKHGFSMFLCHETQVHDVADLPSWLPAPERKSVIIWTAIGMNPEYALNKAWGASIKYNGLCLSVRGVSVSKINKVYSREDFRLTPISQWGEYLKDYLERKRGSTPCGSIWDDEEILYILSPWFQADIFRSLQIPTLDKMQQQATLQKLLAIADLPDQSALGLVDTQSADLSHLASVQELQAFRSILFAFQNQFLFETSDFRLGTVFYLSPVQSGDEIWCLYGCPLPIILRPHPGRLNGYTWVGFVRNMKGLMKGEGLAGFPVDAPLGFTHQGREIRPVDIW